jgi:hypothetical protein
VLLFVTSTFVKGSIRAALHPPTPRRPNRRAYEATTYREPPDA